MKKKNILCITSTFPYGKKETYFQTELEYLSSEFQTVFVLPIYNPYSLKSRRIVPDNVIVLPPILKKSKLKRIFQWLATFNIFNRVFKELFVHNIFPSKYKLQRWFNSVVLYSVGVKRITEKIGKELDERETILYSYWAECPFFVHGKLKKFKKIIRMHGADFYVERNFGYLPLRQQIYESAQCLLPISRDIKNRLEQDYRQPSEKIYLSYLGTINDSLTCTTSLMVNNVIRIISCSNVVKLKRVHLIYDILKEIDSKFSIEWHHIGDGPELENVKRFVEDNKKDNIICIFHGHKDQHEIKDLYSNYYFHWFINVSQYEGLPVSIMEAFSFGIPVLATDVGGTKEIVNDTNGQLLAVDLIKKKEIVTMIVDCRGIAYNQKRSNSFGTWYKQFNANINYPQMLNQILNNTWK